MTRVPVPSLAAALALSLSGCFASFTTATGYEIFGPSAAGTFTATFTFFEMSASVL